jgi:quercetin dioxygenase-like cupin family protein
LESLSFRKPEKEAAQMISGLREKVLDLRPVFGVEARITTPAEATGGEYVEMDCTLEPGGGTAIHYHPEQEETYGVLDGTLEVFLDGHWRAVQEGESLAVPRGAVHGFRNASDTCLMRARKIRGTRDPRSLIHMSMSAVEHRPDVTVKPPQWVIRGLASIGRRLGYTLD